MSFFSSEVGKVNGVSKTSISKIDDVPKTDIYTIDGVGSNFVQDSLPLHVGYSVRQLSATAVNCMDVRNKDGVVRTVGFVDGYVDVNYIQQHCGTGYGSVVRFYDQSPNGYHLEATQWQNAPLIVDVNGNLITRNGKAALQFALLPGEVSVFSNRFLQAESQGGGSYIESIESEWAVTMFVASTYADSTNFQVIASQWQGNAPSDGVTQTNDPNNLHLYTLSSNIFRSVYGMFDSPDYDYSSVQSANNISSYDDYLVVSTVDTGTATSNSSVTMAVNSISPQYTGTTPGNSFLITQDDTYPFYLGKGFSQGLAVYYQGYMNEFIVYSSDSHLSIIPSQVTDLLTQDANEFYGVF